MDSSSGPTVRRRQLGGVLRQLRQGAGLRIEDVAESLETSEARISRMESGHSNVKLKLAEVRTMLDLYGATDAGQIETVVQMFRESQKPAWWASYEPAMPAGFSTVVGLESDAAAERVWEPTLVPGLLQTPDYARALMETGKARQTGQAEQLIALRMERQQLLTRDPEPLELWTVIDESALRRAVGGPEVMRAQVLRIVEAAGQPNINVQVMPLGAGAHPGLNGPFTLLEASGFPTVTYIETQAGSVYLEKEEDARYYDRTFRELCVAAHDYDESLALLQEITKENRS